MDNLTTWLTTRKTSIIYPQGISIQERFWLRVPAGDPSTCWEWQGARDQRGYGQLSVGAGRRPERTHRISWLIHHGAIPTDLYVLHVCDNPACVNPNHLFLGTQHDNMQDMIQKGRKLLGRVTRGSSHPLAKMTEDSVRRLRWEYQQGGISQRSLAKKYGISTHTARDIIERNSWGWLTDADEG